MARNLLEELLGRQHLSKNKADKLARLGRGRTGQFCSGRHRPNRDSIELISLAVVLGLSPDRAGELLDPAGEEIDE